MEIKYTKGAIGICLLGLLSPAYSAGSAGSAGSADNTNSVDEEPTANSNLPDLEFLEFLGQFETDEGEWIDPGSLMAEEFDDLFNIANSEPNPTINQDTQQSNDND